MKLQSTADHSSRRSISRFIRTVLVGCVVLLAAGVLVVAAAGMNPAPLAVLTGGLACLAGVLVIVFQDVGNWAADSEYSLPGKNLVLLLVLVIAATAPVFWSTSL
ncbi:hypothetical protein H9638_16255 [Arthrobacter sp. Sa2BUA2]|uniref:Uncharacterized protein n=1 Tax=Arthrobacter pullicola TaxID=2762224 RepID=A0ABR8YM80_9MICC|nr:hypothetical protein [Arthrobacter pullicola]MBD8045361.1 hypothetical protein [Arthrobacter pullicola]